MTRHDRPETTLFTTSATICSALFIPTDPAHWPTLGFVIFALIGLAMVTAKETRHDKQATESHPKVDKGA